MSETLGRFLAASRLKQGLSVDEVAAATRINSKFIRAAEEDRFDILPGEVFTKGLLRACAKQIGLDGDEIVSRYNSLNVEIKDRSPELISMPLRRRPSLNFRTTVLLLLLFVISIAVFYSLQDPVATAPDEVQEEKRMENREPVITEKEVAEKTSAASDIKEETRAPDEISPEEKKEEISRETEETEVEPAETKPVTDRQAPASDTDKLSDTSRAHNIMLTAESDSWIKVVVDGKIAREIILREGNDVTWWAEKEYILSIGNVAGVKILLDGQTYPLKQPASNVIQNLKLPPEEPDGEADTTENQ